MHCLGQFKIGNHDSEKCKILLHYLYSIPGLYGTGYTGGTAELKCRDLT